MEKKKREFSNIINKQDSANWLQKRILNQFLVPIDWSNKTSPMLNCSKRQKLKSDRLKGKRKNRREQEQKKKKKEGKKQ
jgi:hypothetical protein